MAAATQLEPVRGEAAPSRFAPELELLLACAQPAAGGAPFVDAVPGSTLDWERVLHLADYHRLLPALHAAFSGRDDVPASILSAVRARFENHQRRVLRFTAELARILHQFDRSGIPVLAHKGAALGQLLYGDPAQRQFGDLDFLVRAEDVARARLALQELGYAPKIQLSPRQEKEYLRTGYEHVFGLGNERNLVEVQWQIVPRFCAIDFDVDSLFARAVEMEIEGLRLRTLGNEDQMLVLCVHAAKHQWAQLGMLRDIATLARLRSGLGTGLTLRRQRLGTAHIVAVSLRLAGSLFGLDLAALPALQKEIRGAARSAFAMRAPNRGRGRDQSRVAKLFPCLHASARALAGPLAYSVASGHDPQRWRVAIRPAPRFSFQPVLGRAAAPAAEAVLSSCAASCRIAN